MTPYSVLFQNNDLCRDWIQNLQSRDFGNCGNLQDVKALFGRCFV